MSKVLSAKMERWTPVQAKKILDNHNNCNRPLSDEHAKRLAEAHKRGEWVEDNGESIKFNCEGELVDGQHRLTMVMKVNKPVRIMTIRNVDAGSFTTLDQGKGRTLGDLLAMEDVSSWRTAATVAKFMWLFGQKKPHGEIRKRFSLTMGYNFFKRHRKHIQTATSLVINKQTGKLGMLGGAYARALYIDRKLADDFFIRLMTGDHLATGSPAKKLRDRLLKDKMAQERVTRVTAMLWIMKAWRAHYNGEALDNLRLTHEDFETPFAGVKL